MDKKLGEYVVNKVGEISNIFYLTFQQVKYRTQGWCFTVKNTKQKMGRSYFFQCWNIPHLWTKEPSPKSFYQQLIYRYTIQFILISDKLTMSMLSFVVWWSHGRKIKCKSSVLGSIWCQLKPFWVSRKGKPKDIFWIIWD